MTKLITLIAKNEGFGGPGNIPTLRNNPGDLRHSPHSTHPGGAGHENDIGTIDTLEHGWEDGDRQLFLDARKIAITDPVTGAKVPMHPFTLRDMAYSWAPLADGNPTAAYLRTLVEGFDGVVDESTPLSQVLEIPAS